MKKYLLPKEGNYYKANLHIHTTVSDGKMSPEEVKKAYMDKGYSIVAFTDHDIMVPHTELTDENFVAITAYETSVNFLCWDGCWSYEKTYHLNLYSKIEDRRVSPVWCEKQAWPRSVLEYATEAQMQVRWLKDYSVGSINRLIAKANEEDFLVSYNHPVWSLQDHTDYAELKGVWGIEVYNHSATRGGYEDTPQPFEDLLRKNERVFPLATDDAHSIWDCFGGFTMIKAKTLTYGQIMGALERGDFYSSTGPLIDELYIEDGIVRLTCSPVRKAFLITERRCNQAKILPQGENMTEVTFDISEYIKESNRPYKETDPFIRIEIIDSDGEKAYTKAYYLSEIDD